MPTPPAEPTALRLPAFFSDGMVLQRDLPLPIWGWAAPSESVTVRLADQSQSATADESGRWKVRLKPLPATLSASPPLAMEVVGRSRVESRDVLVGEVWLCSGQSNMEFTVSDAFDAAREIAAANDSRIRQFRVSRAGSPAPQDASFLEPAPWSPAVPRHVGAFTAVGYFFCPRHQSRARRSAGWPPQQCVGRHGDPILDGHRNPAGRRQPV